MFISEEEAKKRRESPNNILGPNYRRNAPLREDAPEASPISKEPEDKEREQFTEKRVQSILDHAAGVRRRNGSLQGQTEIQLAIGKTAAILDPRTAGNLFGLSPAQTNAYREGESSQIDVERGITRNPGRKAAMDLVKDTLAEKAAARLGAALDELTNEKISQEKHAGNIARIAKDMAVVVDKVTKESGAAEHIHFHIFRPEPKVIADYRVVNVMSPSLESPKPNDGL